MPNKSNEIQLSANLSVFWKLIGMSLQYSVVEWELNTIFENKWCKENHNRIPLICLMISEGISI